MKLAGALAAIVFSMSLLSYGAANAGTIKGDWIGCINEESLDNFTQAAIDRDNRLAQSLLGTVCVPINGREFSVLDSGFVKTIIRVYVGGDHIDLWVPAEAAR